ncbi:MAG: universal stress protein [Nitrospirota bacterium]
MSMYKKVLIAVDGSETSMHALREFLRFAKTRHFSITVVSVIPAYEGDLASMWTSNISASMKKACDDSLEQAMKIAVEEEVPVETLCEEGEIFERIIDLADAGNYDLIVLGKKGMSLIEKAFVGSVTERVIGYSRQDVLVIPFGAKVSLKNILVATDGSPYGEAAAQKAIEIAARHQSGLKALSVVDVTVEFMLRANEVYESMVAKAKGYTESIREKASSAGVQAESIVRDGEVYKVIIDTAKEYQADIIIMGSLGRTGLKRLLMGSTTERVLGHAAFPVLIVKP